MNDTVLIYSGGLDSTVLLYRLTIMERRRVLCVSFDYGQRHKIELQHAKELVSMVNCRIAEPENQVRHEIIGLPMAGLLEGSSQTDSSVPVPEGHYAAESMKQTVVPNRNMMMLSVAGAIAIAKKAEQLAYAAHAGDHAIYPDCRPDFIQAMESAFLLADWHPLKLVTPFSTLTKTDIVRLGGKLKVPFKATYSCYKGEEGQHCGRCGTCVERAAAFNDAGVFDPTNYADATYFKTATA